MVDRRPGVPALVGWILGFLLLREIPDWQAAKQLADQKMDYSTVNIVAWSPQRIFHDLDKMSII